MKNTSRLHNNSINNYSIGNIDSLDSILKIIDNIIENVFNNYQIMELSNRENLYVTDKMQMEMIAQIFSKTYNSISKNLINKLLLVYNKEYIEDMIAQKVQQTVLKFTVEVNGNYNK